MPVGHGWPSLFLEYWKLLPLLTDPLVHGTASSDAFSVVVLSLPSSGSPADGGLTHQVAEPVHQHLPILIAASDTPGCSAAGGLRGSAGGR